MRTLAIVTGASRGLGLALSKELAQETNCLITIARQPSIQELDVLVQSHQHQYQHFTCDLSQMSEVSTLCQSLVPFLEQSFDRYLLINNAGVLGPIAQYHGLTPDKAADISRTFDINISAVITLCSTFLHHVQTHKNAKIQVINISSGAARSAYPGWATYCASKAALDRYSEVAQLEAPFAQIVSLAPGVLDTAMQENIRASHVEDFPNLQRFKDLYTNKALSSPTEVARKILNYSLDANFGQPILSDIRLI